jgi:hypothetical protein
MAKALEEAPFHWVRSLSSAVKIPVTTAWRHLHAAGDVEQVESNNDSFVFQSLSDFAMRSSNRTPWTQHFRHRPTEISYTLSLFRKRDLIVLRSFPPRSRKHSSYTLKTVGEITHSSSIESTARAATRRESIGRYFDTLAEMLFEPFHPDLAISTGETRFTWRLSKGSRQNYVFFHNSGVMACFFENPDPERDTLG